MTYNALIWQEFNEGNKSPYAIHKEYKIPIERVYEILKEMDNENRN